MKFHLLYVLRYIKIKYKNCLLSIAGILLSVLLMSVITIFADSMGKTEITKRENTYGSYHICIEGISSDYINNIAGSDLIEDAAYFSMFNKCISNKYRGTIWLSKIHYDNGNKLIPVNIIWGSWPDEENEILLEKLLYDFIANGAREGDKIKLAIETDIGVVTKEFILAGVYNDISYSDPSREKISNIILSNNTDDVITEPIKYSIYLTLKRNIFNGVVDNTVKLLKSIPGIWDKQLESGNSNLPGLIKGNEFGGAKIYFNSSYLALLREPYFADGQSFIWLYSLMVFIVCISGILGIYNIMHISVRERVRQYGIIKAIGATSLQIRKIVLLEAFVLGLITVPIGILASIGLTFALLHIFDAGRNVISEFTISIFSMIRVYILGIIAVLISVWSPSKLAASVSPMEAIRNSGSRLKKHSEHTVHMLENEEDEQENTRLQRFANKHMTVQMKIALCNIWRNKTYALVTIISLSIGTALFIIFSYYISLNDDLTPFKVYDYELRSAPLAVDMNAGFSIEEYEYLSSMPGIKSIEKRQISKAFLLLDKGRSIDSMENLNIGNMQEENIYSVRVVGEDKERFRLYDGFVADGDIKKANDKYTVLYKDNEWEKSKNTIRAGDEITIRFSAADNGEQTGILNSNGYNDVKITIGAVLTGLDEGEKTPCIYMNSELFNEYYKTVKITWMGILTKDNADMAQIGNAVRMMVFNNKNSSFSADIETREENEKFIFSALFILYMFLFIIILIGALGIFNTLNTQVIERKYEYGVMRAIGMTQKQLNNAIWVEGLTYGLISTILGCLIGIILTLYICSRYNSYPNISFDWDIQWVSIITILIVNAIACIFSTFPSIQKIAKSNVIDVIRGVQ